MEQRVVEQICGLVVVSMGVGGLVVVCMGCAGGDEHGGWGLLVVSIWEC